MRDRCRAALGVSTVVALALSAAACTGVGEDEQAFCDAVGRRDAAAAKALLDTGLIDMSAGGGKCAPKNRACTKDLRAYCGCDGQTFKASGSCPGQRYSAKGACK